MTTSTKTKTIKPAGYLKTLDTYSELDDQLLPVFADASLTTARQVTDAVSEIAPDAAQDARFWLLSAMQRGLITRLPDGRFTLSEPLSARRNHSRSLLSR